MKSRYIIPDKKVTELINSELEEGMLPAQPLELVNNWLQDAQDMNLPDHNAMALATVDKYNRPKVRMVLLKQVEANGLVFYTNYQSRKAAQLDLNPVASVAIYWPILERQIRVEGEVVRLNEKASDLYFDSRPHGSKIGAWASPQSQPIPNRNYLENLKSDYEEIMKDRPVNRPEFWGGYLIKPVTIEFWKGRQDRLHDRFEYLLKNDQWEIQRLAP